MDAKPDRSFLCSRCGAITEEAVVGPDGRGEGACPQCGLGFSVVGTLVATFTGAADQSDKPAPPPSPHDAARQRRQEDILRNRPFPVYGLDARWNRARWLAGWGTSNDEIDNIGLAHGDPFDRAAPVVRVATWRPPPRLPALLTAANAAHELAEYMWQEGGAPHDLVRPTFTSEDPTASWSELALSVDGHPVPFRSLAAGSFWVALARIGASLITIEARHLGPDDTGLVTVDDVEPYLASRRP